MSSLKKHYINYGTAKTATTWLHHQLLSSGYIDYNREKEPKLKLLTNQNNYEEYFKDFKFSTNFNPNIWMLDSSQLKFLDPIATHKTIIFRNPYTYANSLYNFWNSSQVESSTFIKSFQIHFDYAKILNRLPSDIIVLYYDDIVSSPQDVLDTITNYIGIPKIKASTIKKNITSYTKNLSFDTESKKLINDLIEQFEDKQQINLNHWKLYV